MVFKAQLMSSLFSQPFSTDLCPLYIIIINIISLFINYTYILYTCHCILHHNTSILIQTIQGAPVAAKTLHYCTIYASLYFTVQISHSSITVNFQGCHISSKLFMFCCCKQNRTPYCYSDSVYFLFIYCSCPHQTAASVKHCFTAAPKRLKNKFGLLFYCCLRDPQIFREFSQKCLQCHVNLLQQKLIVERLSNQHRQNL